MKNNVRKLRIAQLMSKAELARKAGLSALTIDRVESGKPCRMDTKRKIILALGYTLEDKELVFGRDEDEDEEEREPSQFRATSRRPAQRKSSKEK